MASYFKYHVFFCCNQRPKGETCCNNHAATEAQTYAK
ncbi:MAG TPA: (2Fe-2S) ferredoxin domain-containing protein, partial [Accumulibacter sp.]|nr:(2Fe-2S) ferredoxin domain-containing protein [Accumulibacter sp.]